MYCTPPPEAQNLTFVRPPMGGERRKRKREGRRRNHTPRISPLFLFSQASKRADAIGRHLAPKAIVVVCLNDCGDSTIHTHTHETRLIAQLWYASKVKVM